jgi:hypothetical protein
MISANVNLTSIANNTAIVIKVNGIQDLKRFETFYYLSLFIESKVPVSTTN